MFDSFETARLIVRRMTMSDAQELTAISDVAEVSQWMSFMEGGFPLAKARAMIASQSERNETFFAVRLGNGALAGALGMVDHPHAIEIGYWFGLEYQGNGYAYEAVRAYLEKITTDPSLAGRPIIAETHPDNAASIKLLAKAGFAATGRPGHRPNGIGFALHSGDSVDPNPCEARVAACSPSRNAGRLELPDCGKPHKITGRENIDFRAPILSAQVIVL